MGGILLPQRTHRTHGIQGLHALSEKARPRFRAVHLSAVSTACPPMAGSA